MDMPWPPAAQGQRPDASMEYPVSESQVIITEVHRVVDKSFTLSGEFKGNPFRYNVRAKDPTFASKLAAAFSKHLGETLRQLGDLDIEF